MVRRTTPIKTFLYRARWPLVVLFLVCNVGAVVMSSLPEDVKPVDWVERPHLSWPLHYLSLYGFYTGVNNRWTMFSVVHRFDIDYKFYAVLATEERELIPNEYQDPARPTWKKWLLDHRLAKFHLNIYHDERARERYARYLCRAYRDLLSGPFAKVVIEHWAYPISPREYARLTGSFQSGPPHMRFSETFACETAS